MVFSRPRSIDILTTFQVRPAIKLFSSFTLAVYKAGKGKGYYAIYIVLIQFSLHHHNRIFLWKQIDMSIVCKGFH